MGGFIEEMLEEKIIEVDKYTLKEIKKKFNDWNKENPGQLPERSEMLDIIDSVKPKKEEILSAISNVLCETQPIKRLIESNFNTDELANKLTEEIQSVP